MQSSPFEKQMFSTNRRDKIFNIRKMPYKQFDNEKYFKAHYSPFQKKEQAPQPSSVPPKKGEYLPLAISSTAYKELSRKYQAMREEFAQEKERRLQALKGRDQELDKYKTERERLEAERTKLQQRRDELKGKIEELRERNQAMRQQQAQRNEEIRMVNMEYLRNMIIAMRYQNGMEIDTDNMTYEQLLELQEKMGSVSKGITEQQISRIERITAKGLEAQLCSICYNNVKEEEQINRLPCSHIYHVDCIREWLLKERVCPLCKQQIFVQHLANGENSKA